MKLLIDCNEEVVFYDRVIFFVRIDHVPSHGGRFGNVYRNNILLVGSKTLSATTGFNGRFFSSP